MPRPDQVTIPGAGTMTRRGPSMMPGTSIWPEWQKGLLSDKQMNEVMPHFAGGIYGEGGYQVRTPANPQSFGLLGAGDPSVWGGTAAENIMAQPQPAQSMQPVQSQGLLAQPTGQGGGGLLSNTPSGQAQAMPMGQMQGNPSGAGSGGLDYLSQLPPEMISARMSQGQPQGMDPMAGNQIRPVTPSGIWDNNPDPSATGEKPAEGGGAYTLQDLMSYEAALRGANFGNQDPISVFSMFKDAGGGTFDVDYSTPYSGQVFGMNGSPIHEFNRLDTGEPYSPASRNGIIRNRLSGIDESQ